MSSKKTEKGIELAFGNKGTIKLSTDKKKPTITIEFGDEDLQLSVPEYSEPAAYTSMIMFMLLLLSVLVHGTVSKVYNRYLVRLSETKKSAIEHLKIVMSEASVAKPSDLDRVMNIFSIYLAKELNIDKATYHTALKEIKERSEDSAREFTKIYKEFANKEGQEITKAELKSFVKNIINFIKRV